jgi:uncharacterized membrane protein YeiH
MLVDSEFTVPVTIDYLAVALWALSGAIVGWRKGYDTVGVFVIALVSATGGGILRDGLFLQRIPAVATNFWYVPIIVGMSALVILFGRPLTRYDNWRKLVAVIDALATPMFIVIGAQLAAARGLPLSGIILCAAVSGIGGGLLRDMLAGATPELLRPGQYNTLIVVAAALLFVGLEQVAGLPGSVAAWIAIALFFVSRLVTIRYNWRSRPVSEFEITRVVEGLTGWLPGWKRTGEPASESDDARRQP